MIDESKGLSLIGGYCSRGYGIPIYDLQGNGKHCLSIPTFYLW